MANWAFDEHGVFVQWRDRDTPLAVPVGDGPANTASWKLHLNSEYYRLLRRDLGYRLKVGYYRTGFENNQAAGGLASDGHKLSGEGQVDYAGLPDWIWTVGVNTTSDRVRSPGWSALRLESARSDQCFDKGCVRVVCGDRQAHRGV